MTDPNDKFLFAAYALVWIVFMLYAWSLTRRQARLQKTLDELREAKGSRDPASVSRS